MKFIIGFLLLFAGLKAIGSVPYRFSESPWISESVADEGKYHMPGMKTKPKKYWSCVGVIPVDSRNSVDETDKMRGLQYHLLCQSLAGLTNRAVEKGPYHTGNRKSRILDHLVESVLPLPRVGYWLYLSFFHAKSNRAVLILVIICFHASFT